MPVVADLYVPRHSWAHALDPRVKLLFVASFIVLLLVFDSLLFMLATLILVHALHRSAMIPWEKLRFIWKALLPVCILVCVLWTLFYPSGTAILELWIIEITPLAMAKGAALALRILTMALVVFAWLYTTDQPSLVRSLVKLRMPYEWGLVLALALRYIPTFQSTYTQIAEAQQARGLEISGSGFKRVRRMMPIFVAMIISSLRASEQLARALEARAMGAPDVRRSTLRDIRFRSADYVLASCILIVTIALLYLNIRYGVGEHPVFLSGH